MVRKGPLSPASLVVLATIANVILSAPTSPVTTTAPHLEYATPVGTTFSLPPSKVPESTGVFTEPDDQTRGNATESFYRDTNSMATEEMRMPTSADLIRKYTGFAKTKPNRDSVFPSVPVISEEDQDDIDVEEEFYDSQRERIMHILVGAGFGALMSMFIILFIVCAVRIAASTMPSYKRTAGSPARDLHDVLGLGDDMIMDINGKTMEGNK
ncbi:hypothetical protein Bbelb_262710 [Branchiostoma belcheri]|nr:hypothetical protein Bbelb_262710 [Branchiostoma belcheri]